MFNNRGSFLSNIPPVTKNLIIINLIIWAFTFFSPAIAAKLFRYGALHYITASDFNVAQLFTYMFLHDTHNLSHIFFNMFGLFMFGRTVEMVMGGKRFLFFYFTCGIGAALIQELTWYFTLDSIVGSMYGVSASQVPELLEAGLLLDFDSALNMLQTVGASGSIYGILLAFGMLFPNMPLYIMFIPMPVKAKWVVAGYGAIELLVGMTKATDGVAHFAHLGGMLFGVLLILYWRKKGVINGPLY